MFNFIGLGKTAPAPVPTDSVVPLRFYDVLPLVQALMFNTTFVIDDVLDPLKLQQSLAALAERDGWRRLGARLRQYDHGRLEYHIPSHFIRQRPAIEFHHVEYAIPIADHAASKVPRACSQAFMMANPEELQTLVRGPESPRTLDDYLYSDGPQLGLRVVSFTDATLITLYAPHTLMDGMGLKALLDTWSLMLHGRQDDLPKTYPDDVDPLANLGRRVTEPHKLDRHLLSWLDQVLYIILTLYKVWLFKFERCAICIPASTLDFLRQAVQRELTADKDQDDAAKAPFISDGDIMSAARLAQPQQHLCLQRLQALHRAASCRRR
ncbi:hypothetical protein CDD81_2465 [Ophiocordyceps australis]|uniref:Condensation domain-containing protein n=1 Tax=Ophiocordyceps australis TaxID=1399860 RepID=A0A2C5X7K4_9HYPO|nr:hypothetical protein CDD81_2465 [Ophiocordyceps australis]